MPADYREVVLAEYKKKKDKGTLSPNLLNPTPGSLRSECLIVYLERYNSKDDEILRLFFNDSGNDKGYYKIIENTGSNKFKQLPKILKGNIDNPGIRFIELLAWLIDFKPRSSTSYYKSFYEDKQIKAPSIVEEIVKKNPVQVKTDQLFNKKDNSIAIEKNEMEESPSNQSQEPIDEKKDKPTIPLILVLNNNEAKANVEKLNVKENSKKIDTTSESLDQPGKYLDNGKGKSPFSFHKMMGKLAVIIVVIPIGTFLFLQNKEAKNYTPSNTPEKCMHWAGDRYLPIVCNEQGSETPVVSIDFEKLNHFKKINFPDTLTKNSIGKVWYLSINGGRDYFTGSGLHPTNLNKELKPLSPYILYKYSSYYRYLLNRLIWCICILGLVYILYRYLYKFLNDLF